MSDPEGDVVKAAGTIEGVLGAADEGARGQDGVFVLIGAGDVESEAPDTGEPP